MSCLRATSRRSWTFSVHYRCSWLDRVLLQNRGCLLPHCVFDFAQPVGALEDFAGLRAVGSANDAIALHEIDEVRGASVPDAQAALQQGSGCLAILQHDADGILVELVVLVLAGAF